MGKLIEGYTQKGTPTAADIYPIVDQANTTMSADGTNAWVTQGSIPGTLLATHSYGPGTQFTYNIGSQSTLTIMDGTNLTLSFVVPASGNVDIVVSADWAFASSGLTQATDMFMGIVKHGAVGTIYGLQSWFGNNNSIVAGANSTHRYNCVGLTPGPLQIDLATGMSSTAGILFADFYAVAFGFALSTDPANPIFIQAFAA
jgi:hypothetical protein